MASGGRVGKSVDGSVGTSDGPAVVAVGGAVGTIDDGASVVVSSVGSAVVLVGHDGHVGQVHVGCSVVGLVGHVGQDQVGRGGLTVVVSSVVVSSVAGASVVGVGGGTHCHSWTQTWCSNPNLVPGAQGILKNRPTPVHWMNPRGLSKSGHNHGNWSTLHSGSKDSIGGNPGTERDRAGTAPHKSAMARMKPLKN